MLDWLNAWIDQWNSLSIWSRLGIGAAAFVVCFVGSLAATAYVVVQLPADYFLDRRHAALPIAEHHPVLRWSVRILKNLLGYFLVVLGIILSLPGVPGQGILTILIGIMLADFPGKRRFERWLVSQPAVEKGINNLRRRFGHPPLLLEPSNDATTNINAVSCAPVRRDDESRDP
jgi:hypothetical protein